MQLFPLLLVIFAAGLKRAMEEIYGKFTGGMIIKRFGFGMFVISAEIGGLFCEGVEC